MSSSQRTNAQESWKWQLRLNRAMSGPGDGEKFVPTGFLACYRVAQTSVNKTCSHNFALVCCQRQRISSKRHEWWQQVISFILIWKQN